MFSIHPKFVTACNKIVAFVASTLASTSCILSAQDAVPAAPTPKPAEVRVEASRVYVFVDKTGLGHQHAVEARLLESTLVLGADKNAGSLVFDMTSFDADTPAARKRLGLAGTTDEATRTAVNENMRSAAVLDITKYPTATFEVTSAKATGKKNARGMPTFELDGNFQLHGVTKPLKISVQAEQVRGWLHIKGGFEINQSSFGIKPYSKALGAVGVADQLKIYGDLYVAPTDRIVMADIPTQP